MSEALGILFLAGKFGFIPIPNRLVLFTKSPTKVAILVQVSEIYRVSKHQVPSMPTVTVYM